MKRMWKVLVAVSMSFGVPAAASAGCSTNPSKFLPMMEKMHPGFVAGLLDRGTQ